MSKFKLIALLILSLALAACGGETAEPEAVAQASLSQPTAEPTDEPTAEPTSPPPTVTPLPTSTSTTVPPTETAVPETNTSEATAEPTATVPPTATPDPLDFLNGVPLSDIIILPPEVVENSKQILAEGQALGRYPNRFSKIGDSIIANGDFLTRFDAQGAYNLGPYEYLMPTVEHFDRSWVRYGVGIRIGLSAWGLFDPMWADKEWCEPNEIMLDCEIRLNQPSVVLLHLGTNDVNQTFETFLRRGVEHMIDQGVIPVILTKADRFEETVFEEENRNNRILREVAADYQVPLVDFDVLAATLPNRGLKDDNVHLNGPQQHDYNLDVVYEKGHSMHNLVILMMLDEIRQKVIEPSIE